MGVSFPQPEDVGPREWGTETLLMRAPNLYMMKRIEMRKGSKGGLQYHRLKDEAGYMLWGKMKVIYANGKELYQKTLKPGDVFHFPAGAVHQSEALTDCVYIEASTPHFNDRVHVEKDYGIDEEAGGLPSTTLDEVEIR